MTQNEDFLLSFYVLLNNVILGGYVTLGELCLSGFGGKFLQ